MENSEEIVNIVRREGFSILQVRISAFKSQFSACVLMKLSNFLLQARKVHLTSEQASQFYQDYFQLETFSENVAHLSSGPILAMVLSGPGN